MNNYRRNEIRNWLLEEWVEFKYTRNLHGELLVGILTRGSKKFKVTESQIYSIFAQMREKKEI